MKISTRKAITNFLLGSKFQEKGEMISTDGRILFSYQTPIAKRNNTLTKIQINSTRYSHTTTLQQNALAYILAHDFPQIKVTNTSSL